MTNISKAVIAVATVMLASPAYATTIGLSNPLALPAITENSRIIYNEGNSTILNLSGNPLDYTDPLTFGGEAHAEITGLSPNLAFHGSITTANTPSDSVVQAGSFKRDEVQLVTAAGQAASLMFNFNIDYTLTLNTGGEASFYLALDNAWANSADPAANPYTLYSERNIPLLVDGSHSFAVSLSTNDFDPSLLIASGSYLPFSLGVYGLARDASLDWSHTISLTSVTAFDANGNPLAPGDYSLAFATNAAAADPVPEPGTLSLIGVGVIVPCRNWLRRRRAQRRQSAA